MDNLDVRHNIQETFERFAKKLPDTLAYHNRLHALEVREVALKWATCEGISSENELLLLEIATLFHDLGFIESYENNEEVGARMALCMMKTLKFSHEECLRVEGMILATKMPQKPKNTLEQIVCDADLDNLGRPDFLKNTDALWEERKHQGYHESKIQWYRDSFKLISRHIFFTQAAKMHREDQKEINKSTLQALINASK